MSQSPARPSPRAPSFASLRVCWRPAAAAIPRRLRPSPSPSAVVPTPSATPAAWTPVFTDEFSTPGSPDPAKWGYDIGYIANNEKQYYTSRSENVRRRGRDARDRGTQGTLQRLRVHLGQAPHPRPLRVHLRPRGGARRAPHRQGDLAGRSGRSGATSRRRELADLRRDRHHGERRLRPPAHRRERAHGRVQPRGGDAEEREP